MKKVKFIFKEPEIKANDSIVEEAIEEVVDDIQAETIDEPVSVKSFNFHSTPDERKKGLDRFLDTEKLKGMGELDPTPEEVNMDKEYSAFDGEVLVVGDTVEFLGGPESDDDVDDYGDLGVGETYIVSHVHDEADYGELLIDIKDDEDSTFAYELCNASHFKKVNKAEDDETPIETDLPGDDIGRGDEEPWDIEGITVTTEDTDGYQKEWAIELLAELVSNNYFEYADIESIKYTDHGTLFMSNNEEAFPTGWYYTMGDSSVQGTRLYGPYDTEEEVAAELGYEVGDIEEDDYDMEGELNDSEPKEIEEELE